MVSFIEIRKNNYQDSVRLMRISSEIAKIDKVKEAHAVMATENNVRLLKSVGFPAKKLVGVAPSDLIIAIEADSEKIIKNAKEKLDQLLVEKKQGSKEEEFSTLEQAYTVHSDANLAIISVPGAFAARETKKALKNGLHVLLFSDNVSLEEEKELKQLAHKKNLLVMGPGAGTAIINGVGLAFANVIRPGPIGIISAAGTGLQELSSLIHHFGSGITQGIGTGGRDLKDDIGGITALDSLSYLAADESTKCITIISKPPSPQITKKIIEKAKKVKKPVIINFLGEPIEKEKVGNIIFTNTLEKTAFHAVKAVNPNLSSEILFNIESEKTQKCLATKARMLKPTQKHIRGLFSGGTLCSESIQIFSDLLGPIWSNVPLDKRHKLKKTLKTKGNACIDMGEEEFTVGKPHPMIDFSQRNSQIITEAKNKDVGIIFFDLVIGYGSHKNPAKEIVSAIKKAKKIAKADKRNIVFITSICGTDQDPQGKDSQRAILEKEGVLVFSSNAAATKFASHLAKKLGGD